MPSKSLLTSKRIPEPVRKWISRQDWTVRSTPRWVTYYSVCQGKMKKQVYAIKVSKGKVTNVEYVAKQTEGQTMKCRNVEANYMGSKRVFWDGKPASTKTWGYSWEVDTPAGGGWFTPGDWSFDGKVLGDIPELLKEIGLEHCEWRGGMPWGLMEYIEMYRKEPRIERLVSMGLWFAVKSVRNLNVDGKSVAAVFKITPDQAKRIGQVRSMDQIYFMRRHPKITDFERYMTIERMAKNAGIKDVIVDMWTPDMDKYIDEISGEYRLSRLGDYIDYLDELSQLGYDLKDKKYLFPANFQAEHAKTSARLTKMKNKAADEKIMAQADMLANLIYENSEYLIRPAHTAREMASEGSCNKNCVGTYVERVAEGKSSIMFMRKTAEPDKTLVTVELQGKHIIQQRGFGNRLTSPDEREFISIWAKKNHLVGAI